MICSFYYNGNDFSLMQNENIKGKKCMHKIEKRFISSFIFYNWIANESNSVY